LPTGGTRENSKMAGCVRRDSAPCVARLGKNVAKVSTYRKKDEIRWESGEKLKKGEGVPKKPTKDDGRLSQPDGGWEKKYKVRRPEYWKRGAKVGSPKRGGLWGT